MAQQRQRAPHCASLCALQIQIGGSVPPLNESYRPDLLGTEAEMLEEYAMIQRPHLSMRAVAAYADPLWSHVHTASRTRRMLLLGLCA